jgi:hypothetical protein
LRPTLFFTGLFALLLAAHLAHSGVLWEGEGLPLAAAMQMMRGGTLYRDIWFDKPPLVPAVYLLWGAKIGIVLRIAGAVYAMASCILAYLLAKTLWTQREGYWAAALLGFFLTFDTHSAVVPLAADLLLLAPHLAAVLLGARKQAFWSGVVGGVGFLLNTKAVFVLAACVVFDWPDDPALFSRFRIPNRDTVARVRGFLVPTVIALAWMLANGSLAFWLDQVWRWPAQYAASPVVSDPVWNGVIRTVNWLGFHAALAVGAAVFLWRTRNWRFAAWIVLCYAGVVLGWRFFPRYFFLLLAPLVIAAARGFTLLRARNAAVAAALLLIVPLVRFGPRYAMLTGWSDLALDDDSRAASRIIQANAPPDATLYVWGYRPDIFVYTKLRPANRFLDSQAMTGVPADRHLTQSDVVATSGTSEARGVLAHSHPDILVDGLSLYNPALSMDHYPELRAWLADYVEIGRTKGTIIYKRRSAG